MNLKEEEIPAITMEMLAKWRGFYTDRRVLPGVLYLGMKQKAELSDLLSDKGISILPDARSIQISGREIIFVGEESYFHQTIDERTMIPRIVELWEESRSVKA